MLIAAMSRGPTHLTTQELKPNQGARLDHRRNSHRHHPDPARHLSLPPRLLGAANMTFAGSIFLIAVGAILRFATHFHVKGLDLRTIGLILMIAGAVGLVIAIWQWAVWSRRSTQAEVLVDDRRTVDPEYRDPPR
jgi:hypothetical protein